MDILYFSLEESEEKIICSEISKKLLDKFNIEISIRELISVGRYNTISEDILDKIEEVREEVEGYLSKIKIITHIRNPTGIYKYVRDFAMDNGNYFNKNGEPFTEEQRENIVFGLNEEFKNIGYYKTNHNSHYVIIIIDHISLIEIEKDCPTKWDAMNKLSSQYCLQLKNRFGFTPVIVQQQSSAKEQVEYNFQGKSINEKLEPSLDSLANMKESQRDVNIAFGLFAPDRYGIDKHNGFDITKFKDNYRSLSILKHRDGVSNVKLPLYFNGKTDVFKELPKPTKENEEKIKKIENQIIAKRKKEYKENIE